MATKKGMCLLCRKEKDLIKAHIFPEHMYKKLYDSNHRYTEVTTSQESASSKYQRKGLRDDSILCLECDREVLGELDNYAARVLWGYGKMDLGLREYYSINDPRVRWKQADNVKSDWMKLFFLSILWRAHVSRLPFFGAVDLGQRHGETVRKIIRGRLPDDRYPILLLQFSRLEPDSQAFMSQILRHKRNGKTFYSAIACGLRIVWFISEDSLPPSFKNYTVEPERPLKVVYSATHDLSFIAKFLGEDNVRLISQIGENGKR